MDKPQQTELDAKPNTVSGSFCKSSRCVLAGLFFGLAGVGVALSVLASKPAGLGCPVFLLGCGGLTVALGRFPGLARYLFGLCVLSLFLLVCLLLSLGVYAIAWGAEWVYVLLGYCFALFLVFLWGSCLIFKYLKDLKQRVRTYECTRNSV